MVLWGQFVILRHASWPQHVTFHHFPRLAPCKASGRPTVYNTSHSACCSSMKCLFIGTIGVQRVICLFWMRSGGFDKVSWIKALEGGLKDRSQGLLGVRKATAGRPAALCVADGPIKWHFSPLFLCWRGDVYLFNLSEVSIKGRVQPEVTLALCCCCIFFFFFNHAFTL